LRDEPLIRSGREANYEEGKDTGRFWDAGAANVHWVIVGEDQVEEGIKRALSQVKSAGVIVEGNSFLEYIAADFAIICARAGENKLKTSARRTLEKADAVYLSTIDEADRETAIEGFAQWRASLSIALDLNGTPIFTHSDIPRLVESIRESVGVSSVVNFQERRRDACEPPAGCGRSFSIGRSGGF